MYYEIIFGSGFYWCDKYFIHTTEPTTDYGALVDVLIDYLVEQGHRNILARDSYEWAEDGENLIVDGEILSYDTFVQGGNCSDVLMHYGEFRINPVSADKVELSKVINME